MANLLGYFNRLVLKRFILQITMEVSVDACSALIGRSLFDQPIKSAGQLQMKTLTVQTDNRQASDLPTPTKRHLACLMT